MQTKIDSSNIMKLRSQVLKMYINIFKVSDVPSSTTLKLGVLGAGGEVAG